MIIVNEVMENIVIISGYNTSFEMFNLFPFRNKILNYSFISIILVVGNVEKQSKECEKSNNGNNISIVFLQW